jgi:hypothetical protein
MSCTVTLHFSQLYFGVLRIRSYFRISKGPPGETNMHTSNENRRRLGEVIGIGEAIDIGEARIGDCKEE